MPATRFPFVPNISSSRHSASGRGRPRLNMASHSRGAVASGSCAVTLETRVQGMPGARCTRGLVCKVHKRKRTRAYRAAEAIRHSLRNGSTAYAMLTSATNSSCHRRLRIKTCPSPVGPTRLHRLDISNGCQAHTVLPYASTSVVCVPPIAHGPFASPPCHRVSRPTLPRPPHPIPRS
jgi:hypothetical protein